MPTSFLRSLEAATRQYVALRDRPFESAFWQAYRAAYMEGAE